MASGIQVFAPDGRLKLDTNDRISRVVGRVVLPITTTIISGQLYVDRKEYVDPAMAQSGANFVYVLTDQAAVGRYRGPGCGIDGTTIWAYPAAYPDGRYASALGGSFMTVIYGKW